MRNAQSRLVRGLPSLLVVAALVAGATPILAQTPPEEPTSKVQIRTLDARELEAVRSQPNVQHFLKMAEEFRLLTESRLLGTPMPELTTNEVQIVPRANGQKARLGIQHLNTAIVTVSPDGELEAACGDTSALRAEARTSSNAEVE